MYMTTRSFFLLLLIFTISCSKQETVALREASGGKKYGGTYTLNEIRGNPASLDPVRITSKVEDDIATNIYDHLVDNGKDMNVTAELAKSWEISPDGLTYTFHLRTDAYFHDNKCFPDGKGRKFVAADVKYSLERVCDPKSITSGFWIFQDIVAGANDYFNREQLASQGKNITEVSGFQIVNDSTFVVHLAKPFAPFLSHLTTSFGFIIPREAIEFYGKDYFKNPVGTGAFRFKQWKEDQDVTLERNPKYWQFDDAGNRLPLLDEVKFTFIKDDKTLLASFERGTHDENFTLPTESFQQYITPQKSLTASYKDKYVLQHVTAMNTYFFDFLCSKPPFNNRALRRAFSFAVDRDKLVKYILKGAPHGPAHHFIVPPAFAGYPIESVKGIAYDLDSARYWLAQAGFKNGADVGKIELAVYNEPRPMQIAQAVQSMIQEGLGITVELRVMQTAQLLDASEDGTLQFWLTRWYADYPEIENFLNLVYGRLVPKDQTMKSYPNSTRWNNEAFNHIFDKALATTNDTERLKLYAEAENIAAFDAPIIPLFYEEHYRLLQKWVRDNPLDAMNRIDMKFVWLDK
jgi:peptide/nickel transport system substrate-binding protein